MPREAGDHVDVDSNGAVGVVPNAEVLEHAGAQRRHELLHPAESGGRDKHDVVERRADHRRGAMNGAGCREAALFNKQHRFRDGG